jgi:hypothetical protein
MQQQVINNLRTSLQNHIVFIWSPILRKCSLGVLWTLGSFFGNVMEHFLFPISTTDLFCWIFTTQGLKKSSATHTKDSCEKNVPKLPEFKECYFRSCSLCVTVNSVKCLVFRSPGMYTLCYCELWVHSFENLKHFLFELFVVLGNECYGTFSYKPFAWNFKAFQTSVLNIGWQCIW